MLILSIDSCGSACAACVWQDGRVLARARTAMLRGQDARLMPMIVDVVGQSGYGFADVDRIAVTRGPGSFTGLRVGLAAAVGIGLAADKPVIGIDRFAAYHALHADAAQNLLVVIDSRRADLFCRFYPADAAPQPPCLMTEAQIDTFIAAQPDTMIVGDRAHPDADVVAACAMLAAAADARDDSYQPTPLYLRAPDVTTPAAMSR